MKIRKQYGFLCPLMRLMVRAVILDDEKPSSTNNRIRLGILEGRVSMVLSILLSALKGWLGLISGSVSLIADAINNLADAGSSLMIALSFQWSRKPRDENHPFGHGRIEAVSTLVLSIALILVGFEVGRSGVVRLINPKPVDASMWLLIVLGVSIFIKLWMALFARRLARMTESQVLEADAWNHTFDVICSLMVIVALVGARLGYPALDGWTALGVSLFILYTGGKYAREAIDVLLGKKPDADEIAAIHKVASGIKSILGIHEIMVHNYGDVKMVSFHIEVDSDQSVCNAHHIAEQAEQAVEHKLGWRAVVHVDPIDRSHPFFAQMNEALTEFVEDESDLVDFHDLRITGSDEPYDVSFDLVTTMAIDSINYDAIYERALKLVRQVDGCVASALIGIEALVDSAPMKRKRFKID